MEMIFQIETFRKEALHLFKKTQALWPVSKIFVFDFEDGETFETLFCSDISFANTKIVVKNAPDKNVVLFKHEVSQNGISPLFERFELDALISLHVSCKSPKFIGFVWPEAWQHKDAIDLTSFAYSQLFNQYYLNGKLQKRNERTKQVISVVTVLHEISRAFEGSKSLENLLLYIVERAQVLMRTESASLMLHLEETNELEFKVVLGPKSEEVKPFRLAMGKGIAGWVAQNQEAILIPDAYQDARFDPSFDKRSGYVTRSILCVPMIHKGKTIGVMTVINRDDLQPFADEDKNLMLTFASQAALAIENARLLQSAIEKERLDKELQVAAEIQNLLIPHELPRIKGLSLSATYLPCKEVSGDFYDIVKLDENRSAFVVADVAGKGIPGAMLVSTMQATLSAYLEESDDLVSIVNRLNVRIIKNSTEDRFITFFIGLYDSLRETLIYVNAGHNPPILLQNNKIHLLEKGGIFIGSLPWEYECAVIELKQNDVLTLYTDGLVEAMDSNNEEFSEKRLEEVIIKNKHLSPDEILKKITDAVDEYATHGLDDDFTLVVVKKD